MEQYSINSLAETFYWNWLPDLSLKELRSFKNKWEIAIYVSSNGVLKTFC